MKNSITFDKIEKNLMRPKAWWAVTTILPPLKVFLYIYLNFSSLPAYSLTIASFICASGAAALFFKGMLIWGAIVFQLSYFLDCADGTVARIRNSTSELWGYFDFFFDRLKILFNTIALSVITNEWIYGMIFLFLSVIYFLPWKFIDRLSEGDYHPSEFYKYPTDVEAQALIFVLFPLINKPFYGMVAGSIILIFNQGLFFLLFLKKLKKS